MSITIKNLDMPIGCQKCKFFYKHIFGNGLDYSYSCILGAKEFPMPWIRQLDNRAVDCPIIEIESEDCISRESVRQLICKNNDRYGYSDRFHEFTEECLQLPSVTPQYTDAEIQKMQELEQAEIEKAYELGKAEQLNTGRWIFIRMNPTNFNNEYECSECGRRISCTTRQLVNYPYCHCGAKMENGEMK